MMEYRLSAACGCNIGRRRGNNEDNFYFDGHYLPAENHALDQILTQACTLEQAVDFGVFDGMGGQADGQIASNLAAVTFDHVHRKAPMNVDPQTFLSVATQQMTDAVWTLADQSFSNMGTTAAILRFCHDSFYLCNVGDSRIFLFRDRVLKQISVDHTDEQFLKENGISKRKPSLTQYIGVSPEELVVEPYLFSGALSAGDQYLICSDGLTDMVSNEKISSILMQNAASEEKVAVLIQTALENGGRDNITVILIQVEDGLKSSVRMEDAARHIKDDDVLQELTAVLSDLPKRKNTAIPPAKMSVPPERKQRGEESASIILAAHAPESDTDSDCGTQTDTPRHVRTKNKEKRRKTTLIFPVAAVAAVVLIIVGIAFFVHSSNSKPEKKYTDDGLFYYIEEVTESNITVKSTYDAKTDELYTVEVYDANLELIGAKDYTSIGQVEDTELPTAIDMIEAETAEEEVPEPAVVEEESGSGEPEQESPDLAPELELESPDIAPEEDESQQPAKFIQDIDPDPNGSSENAD